MYYLTTHMVYLVKKKIKGKNYLYLTKSARVKGKSKVVWQLYLGPEAKIENLKDKLSQEIKKVEYKSYVFGLPSILMKYARRLKLVEIINSEVNKREQGRSVGEYLLIACLNRCIQPVSKSNIRNWMDQTYLKIHFTKFDTYLDSNAYTNHFKYFTMENIARMEKNILQQLIKEFQIDLKDIFYDPTNYYTYINPKTQLLPRHGKSKEGRNILNIVGLSIFCSSDGGVPILHQTYPGNIMDATLFKTEFPRFVDILKTLDVDSSRITLIFDKGNLSDEVFQEIQQSGVHFICSIRPSTQKELHHLRGEDFEIFTLKNGKKVGIKEFRREIYGGRYSLFVTFNPNTNQWNGSNKMKKILKKIEEVEEYFAERLNARKWRNKTNVLQKIDRIINIKDYLNYIYFSVEGNYGELKLSISLNEEAMNEHLKTLGKSYFLTNIDDKKPDEIIWLYRQQYTVENAFKIIKNANILSIRPVYHHLDSSIRGHSFSVIIGLMLLSLIHRDVVKQFPDISFQKMLRMLSEIRVTEIKIGNVTKYQLERMTPEIRKLSNFLKLKDFLK
ncbi:MAG: IS1634 family transposase [Bacteroidales bacterium]|nr:IS1634 family transposase [Bacteroidales bacterium]